MKRSLAEAVVDFLGFHNEAGRPLAAFRQFNSRKWQACLAWLHDAGLALYFLKKLKDHSATCVLPEWVLQNLEQSLEANRQRSAVMVEQFRIINHALDESGARYAVVKGFSLVPEFCPDIQLRPLSDLDYLVEPGSVTAAQRAIERNGYWLKGRSATEIKFLPSSACASSPNQDQYSAEATHAVELHLALWDAGARGLSMAEPTLSDSKIEIQTYDGSSFPVLSLENVFILQVVHSFHHILSYWLRMSCIYEIGYFLNRRENDDWLWSRVEDRHGRDPVMREVVAFLVELSARFFAANRPAVIVGWTQEMRPSVRMWIEQYAKTWIYGNNHPGVLNLFSPAKLAMFLHEQYVAQGSDLVRSRLFAARGLTRLAQEAKTRPAVLLNSNWRRNRMLTRKAIFHLGAGLRYLWEARRWRRMNRAMARDESLLHRLRS